MPRDKKSLALAKGIEGAQLAYWRERLCVDELEEVVVAARTYIHCATMQQWDKLAEALDVLDGKRES